MSRRTPGSSTSGSTATSASSSQEVRVAQAGVQILFAFLLTLPFTQRFGTIYELRAQLYLVTLVLAAAASIFLIAPVIQHRINFRRDLRPASSGTRTAWRCSA